MTRISRYLWEQKNGPIPKGLKICHTCDNPKCIFIDHFFLGTQAENLQDMTKKGRRKGPEGIINGRTKLTEQQVREIRIAQGIQKEIASLYRVSRSRISTIKNKKQWKNLK